MNTRKLPFGFYKPSSPTDHVVKYAGQKKASEGPGLVVFIFPWNTVARIPTTDVAIPFSFQELSSDLQTMNVQGEILVRYQTADILTRRDFTIDPWTNHYLSDDPDKVREEVTNALQLFVRKQIQAKDLRANLTSVSELEEAVLADVRTDTIRFKGIGVTVANLFITKISTSHELQRAIEAEAREKALADMDRAVAQRRMDAAESERTLRTFEAETDRTLEEKRAALIEIRNENVINEAEADSKAAAKRLEPYRDMDGQILLALSFKEMAEQGVGELNITPDFLAALNRDKSAS